MRLFFWIVAGALSLLTLGAILMSVWKPWIPRLELVSAGNTGRRISTDGIFGNYFPAKSNENSPAILLIGGSDGGLTAYYRDMAISLQASGFSVLHISYYRAPGQPENLELIPLETFFKGLDWLSIQPKVDANRLAIVGHSKGAEAALLVASRRPDIKATVIGAPSSVVWPGVNWSRGGGSSVSSWSVASEAMPFLPMGRYNWREGFSSLYKSGLDGVNDHPDAIIPVELINSPILIVCGEEDKAWPSCMMAQQIMARSADNDGPSTQLLTYSDAGHFGFGAPQFTNTADEKRSTRMGGTLEGNIEARKASWPKIVEFLRTQLSQ